jgi:hypothetical protein
MVNSEIHYKWSHDGGFIIRFDEKTSVYKLFEVPMFGGDEQFIGNFSSLDEAKAFADNLF